MSFCYFGYTVSIFWGCLSYDCVTSTTFTEQKSIHRRLLFLNGHIPQKLTGKKLVLSLDVLSIMNSDVENYLGQMYPVDYEIKDTTDNNISASYLDFLRSANFILPCMTNATVSASTSQTCHSKVAIFNFRPPMAVLSRSVYDMPMLAIHMGFLYSKDNATFQ